MPILPFADFWETTGFPEVRPNRACEALRPSLVPYQRGEGAWALSEATFSGLWPA